MTRSTSTQGAQAVTNIHGWAPGEYEKYRSLLLRVIVRQSEAGHACTCFRVACGGCEGELPVCEGYRCYHCMVVLCGGCAREHFGDAPVPEELVAMRKAERAQNDAQEVPNG